ncbi:hypothetical protein LVJ94_01545 [Pendulispora rubella]|uniref:Uncharacterized protein n=1 Tax=Pendulispora rubella TaxID=2741070 RepID=A0ABZ2L4T2_9BACT
MLRAPVDGIAHWSEEFVGAADEVTGLPCAGFGPGDDDVRLELLDDSGEVVFAVNVPRDARPAVENGAFVERGAALLVTVSLPEGELVGGAQYLRRFLSACPRPDLVAKLAPCDAIVEAIEPTRVRLRALDGRLRSVRRPRAGHLCVAVGDRVRAGDTVVDGSRSHQALLAFWGEARLAAHMIAELENEAALQGIAIPRVHWSLAIRAMLAWRRILHAGDTGWRRHEMVSRDTFERVQRETVLRGGKPATAVPALRGFAAMARQR